MSLRTLLLAAVTAMLPSLSSPVPAQAQAVADGPMITDARVRETRPGAPVTAAYLRLQAGANGADRLLAIKVDPSIAGTVEIHDMFEDAGMMKMRRIEGVEFKPGSPAELKPGGKHAMLMNMRRPLAAGDTIKLVLVFEKAGEIAVDAKVEAIGPPVQAKDVHKDH